MAKKINKDPRTVPNLPRVVQFGLGIVGLLLSYAFGTRAIDTGSLLQYTGCIVMFVLSIRLFIISIFNKRK